MQLLFMLPMILNFSESVADTWTRHLIFYLAQIISYYFLDNFISNEEGGDKANIKPNQTLMVVPFIFKAETPLAKWFEYLTDQGIEHFLTLPLLFWTVTMVRIKSVYLTNTNVKKFIYWTVTATTALTVAHMGEFLIESQKFFPVFEGETFEIIEHGLYIVGLFCFWFGLTKLPATK